MRASNLHFPPEIRESPDEGPGLRRAIRLWRGMRIAEPELRAGGFRISGYGPEHPLHGHRAHLLPSRTPHSLLFRTEDNLAYVTKILRRRVGFSPAAGFEPSAPGSRALHYASVGSVGTGRLWTPTTTRLEFALANYGAHWPNHFQTAQIDENLLGMLGISLERRRILLLAIEARKAPLFLGMDLDELVLRGPISVGRIFILNDSPELFSRLADIEALDRGLPPHVRERMQEKFLALSSD